MKRADATRCSLGPRRTRLPCVVDRVVSVVCVVIAMQVAVRDHAALVLLTPAKSEMLSSVCTYRASVAEFECVGSVVAPLELAWTFTIAR